MVWLKEESHYETQSFKRSVDIIRFNMTMIDSKYALAMRLQQRLSSFESGNMDPNSNAMDFNQNRDRFMIDLRFLFIIIVYIYTLEGYSCGR